MATSSRLYLNNDSTPLDWGLFPVSGTYWSKLNNSIASPDDGTYIMAKGVLASGLQARLDLGLVPLDMQTLTGINIQIRGKWTWDTIHTDHVIIIHAYDSSGYLGGVVYDMTVATVDTWYSYSVKSITGLSCTRAEAETLNFLFTAAAPVPTSKYDGVYCSEFEVTLVYTPVPYIGIPFKGSTNGDVITVPSSYTTAKLFPQEEITGTPGTIPSFEPPTMPVVKGGIDTFYYGEVYDRIWCVPNYMRPQNPSLNTDIPFTIWNAYPVPAINTLNTIGGSGQTGLSLDLSTPSNFNAIEEREVNLQIGSTAPADISALYEFNFDWGQGVFNFETVTANWIYTFPEQPVIETWEWLSDVIRAWDSTEQRISIRRQPRRNIEYSILIKDEEDRRREYDRWYTYIRDSIVIPFYQYSTRITQDSVITDTRIYFNPNRTDVRDGELIIIYRPSTDDSYLLSIDAVQSDGATLSTPLTVDINRRDIISPAFNSRINNLTGLRMTSVSGGLTIKANTIGARSDFKRPGSTAVINEFDSLPLLDIRPLARDAAPEIFDTNPSIIDNESGVIDQKISWLHTMISGIRKFSIARIRNPIEMDWWRDFITNLVGMREPFLIPTWRRDLTLAKIPSGGDFSLEINENNYTSRYWPYDTYKRVQLENSVGEIEYRIITNSQDLPGGTTLISLDTALPNNIKWEEDFIISYLNKSRLTNDVIRLRHYSMYTIIELTLRTIDS